MTEVLCVMTGVLGATSEGLDAMTEVLGVMTGVLGATSEGLDAMTEVLGVTTGVLEATSGMTKGKVEYGNYDRDSCMAIQKTPSHLYVCTVCHNFMCRRVGYKLIESQPPMYSCQ